MDYHHLHPTQIPIDLTKLDRNNPSQWAVALKDIGRTLIGTTAKYTINQFVHDLTGASSGRVSKWLHGLLNIKNNVLTIDSMYGLVAGIWDIQGHFRLGLLRPIDIVGWLDAAGSISKRGEDIWYLPTLLRDSRLFALFAAPPYHYISPEIADFLKKRPNQISFKLLAMAQEICKKFSQQPVGTQILLAPAERQRAEFLAAVSSLYLRIEPARTRIIYIDAKITPREQLESRVFTQVTGLPIDRIVQYNLDCNPRNILADQRILTIVVDPPDILYCRAVRSLLPAKAPLILATDSQRIPSELDQAISIHRLQEFRQGDAVNHYTSLMGGEPVTRDEVALVDDITRAVGLNEEAVRAALGHAARHGLSATLETLRSKTLDDFPAALEPVSREKSRLFRHLSDEALRDLFFAVDASLSYGRDEIKLNLLARALETSNKLLDERLRILEQYGGFVQCVERKAWGKKQTICMIPRHTVELVNSIAAQTNGARMLELLADHNRSRSANQLPQQEAANWTNQIRGTLISLANLVRCSTTLAHDPRRRLLRKITGDLLIPALSYSHNEDGPQYLQIQKRFRRVLYILIPLWVMSAPGGLGFWSDTLLQFQTAAAVMTLVAITVLAFSNIPFTVIATSRLIRRNAIWRKIMVAQQETNG